MNEFGVDDGDVEVEVEGVEEHDIVEGQKGEL